MDAVDNKEKKTLHIVDYVTQNFIKHGKTQKTIENARQTTQQSEIINEADNKLENYFTNNKSLLYDTVDDYAEISSTEKSNMPNSNFIKIRKTSFKRKRKESTKQAKRVLPREKKKKKLDKISLDSQLMRLHLVTNNDKKAHINCEAVKKIPKKELIFASLLFEMHQILQAL